MDSLKSYQPDRPIEHKRDDRFGRWRFAERIADTIGQSSDPAGLVIGIYGEWGDGKSSTLNLMTDALKKYDTVLIRFNPWYFNSEEQLIQGFFTQLADELGKSLKTGKDKVAIALKAIGSFASLASGSVLGGAVTVNPGDAISKWGEGLSETDLNKRRGQVEKILDEENKRVVVLIDDIDRLDKEEIQAIFKLVKLSANFKYVTYILAFDEDMVAAALAEKYGGQDGGRKFIEKIIQVPLHLPEADSLSLRKFTLEAIRSSVALSGIILTEEQVQIFTNEFLPAFQRRVKTPRQVKRYANTLAFALPILKGEVNPVDQMLIEGIRVFYPDLYVSIRKHSDIFLGQSLFLGIHKEELPKRTKEIMESIAQKAGLDIDEKAALNKLINFLFPRFHGGESYGSEWDKIWNDEKRVSWSHHFQRYFSYAIPAGDVSDQELEDFLIALPNLDHKEALSKFEGMAQDIDKAGRLVDKLRYRENSMPIEIVKKLSLIVAERAVNIPVVEDLFSSPLSQAAALVVTLICRIPDMDQREKFAESVVEKTKSLGFIIEVFRWLRHPDSRPEVERRLTQDGEAKLGKLIAKKIKKVANKEIPYKKFPTYAFQIFWTWSEYGDKTEVNAYLKKKFETNLKDAPIFLRSMTPTAYGGGKVLPHKSDFSEDSYRVVSRIIDPAIVSKALKKVYGKELDGFKFNFSDDEISVENRIANQFAFIHQKILNESKKDPILNQ
jgi:hypothetical protein